MKGIPGNSLYLLNIILNGIFLSFMFLCYPFISFENKHFPMHVTVYKLPSSPFSCLTLSTMLWSSIIIPILQMRKPRLWKGKWTSQDLNCLKNDFGVKPRFLTINKWFPLHHDQDTFYQMVSHPKISQASDPSPTGSRTNQNEPTGNIRPWGFAFFARSAWT